LCGRKKRVKNEGESGRGMEKEYIFSLSLFLDLIFSVFTFPVD
jgi:hypothetical protein